MYAALIITGALALITIGGLVFTLLHPNLQRCGEGQRNDKRNNDE